MLLSRREGHVFLDVNAWDSLTSLGVCAWWLCSKARLWWFHKACHCWLYEASIFLGQIWVASGGRRRYVVPVSVLLAVIDHSSELCIKTLQIYVWKVRILVLLDNLLVVKKCLYKFMMSMVLFFLALISVSVSNMLSRNLHFFQSGIVDVEFVFCSSGWFRTHSRLDRVVCLFDLLWYGAMTCFVLSAFTLR